MSSYNFNNGLQLDGEDLDDDLTEEFLTLNNVNQSADGFKTFKKPVSLLTLPTEDTHATNKEFVETYVSSHTGGGTNPAHFKDLTVDSIEIDVPDGSINMNNTNINDVKTLNVADINLYKKSNTFYNTINFPDGDNVVFRNSNGQKYITLSGTNKLIELHRKVNLQGNIQALQGARIKGLQTPTSTDEASTKGYVDNEITDLQSILSNDINKKINKSGDEITGNLVMTNNSRIQNIEDIPTGGRDAINKNFVNTNFLKLNGTQENLNMNNNDITNIKKLSVAGTQNITKSGPENNDVLTLSTLYNPNGKGQNAGKLINRGVGIELNHITNPTDTTSRTISRLSSRTLTDQNTYGSYLEFMVESTGGINTVPMQVYPSSISMKENLDMNKNKIIACREPTDSTDVATKKYVDTHPGINGNYLKTDGTNSMTANLNLGGNKIENIATLNMNQNRITNLKDIPVGGKDAVNKNFVMNQLEEYEPAFNIVRGTRPGTQINAFAKPMYDVAIPINIQGYLKVELYFPFLQSSGGSNKPVYQVKSRPNTVIQFSNGKFVYQGAGVAIRHTGYINNLANQFNSIIYRIEASTTDGSTVNITHQDLNTSYNISRVSVA